MNCALPLLIVTALLAGCGAPPKKDQGSTSLPPPKPPTASPRRVDKPIDHELRRDAVAELNRAHSSPDVVIRANAIEATQRSLGVVGADKILNGLDDKASVVRFASALAAGTLQIREAKPKLVALVDDPSKRVQIGARYALHKLGDTGLSHDLESYAIDPDPRVRADTVMVLGLLGEPSAIKILGGMEQERDPGVRLQVVEAKYRLGDPQAMEDLVVGTVSKFPDDQIVSLLALGSRREEKMSQLMRGKLTSDYVEVTLAAARALGMIGSDDGMGVALKAADSKDPRQRSMAALALGDIGRSDAQSALGKLLNDPDPVVRLSAATAILQLRAN